MSAWILRTGAALLGSLFLLGISATPADAQQPVTGLFYYAAQNLQTGEVEQRGIAGSNGVAFDNLLLTPNTPYRLWVLQAATLKIDNPSVITNSAGQRTQAPDLALHDDGSPDSDGDGLHDDSEFILGSDPTDPDSDSDGVPDGAEVQQGTNALDGLAARTGVIGVADTPGTAKDVCAFNDVAVVADQDGGVSVFNVFNGMNPVIIAQLTTPGSADRVACAGNLIAVADGSAGLAVIDITDPRTAHISQQVALEAVPQAVVTAANIAFAGLANGKVVAIDMTSGAKLAAVVAGGAVQDLRIAGDVLYVLLPFELQTYSLQPDFLDPLGHVTTSSYGPEGITGIKRLFVGGDLAYATAYPGYDVIDVSNPGSPRVRAPIVDTLASASFKQIVANGSGIGVAAAGVNPRNDGTHDVWIYDVTAPGDNRRLKTVLTTPGIARALSIFDGLAYVADSASGLEAVNYLEYDKHKQAPTISLSTNFAPGLAEENKILRVTAAVTDDVQVRNVEFYVDGAKVATDGDFPFEIRFIVPPRTRQGGFTLRARASDTGGNATFTDEMQIAIVTDATPPTVTRVSPDDGAVTSGVDVAAAFFSEPINPASLAGFSLMRNNNGTLVPVAGAAVQYRDAVNGAFIGVSAPLPAGRYVATLPATVADLAGNPLGTPVTWGFVLYNLGSDRDHDCVPDSLESTLGLNPDNADSNGNGTPDGDEDFDHDGLSNCGEVQLSSDPTKTDSNSNGVLDGNEDTDGDGITDGEEVVPGADGFRTDPLSADTDGGGVDDGAEIALGTNPTNPSDDTHDVVVSGRAVTLNGRVQLTSLALRDGAVVTLAATNANAPRLELAVSGTLSIDATSKIDLSGQGFLGGHTGANADGAGQTAGNVAGSTGRSGGSHGGLGGLGTINDPNSAGTAYDDPRDPAQPGAGGATACGTGNNSGGGLMHITAGTLQLDGMIAADGGSSGNGCAGGGAGGSIKLQVGTLKGGGSIHANGGSVPGGGNGTGGGGGGRIAVFYGNASGFTFANIAALGGNGTQSGAPGTIFLQHPGDLGELIVRGTGPETPLPEGFATDHLTIDGARVAVNQSRPASLTLRNGAVLTHPGATTNSVSRLDLQVGTLSIDAQSSIDVTGRGFLGGATGGNSDPTGRTFGNAVGSTGRSGGSHGGPGALGGINNPNTAGAVYDDFRDPTQPGGGGATACGAGTNNGGGVVHITADTLQLDGLIAVDGASTGNGCTGGGAGGSVKLEVGTLSGGGSVRADGGNVPGGGNGTGGGGGGRVAIVYETNSGFDLDNKVEAVGGTGTANGALGTVYLRPTSAPLGTLIVDGKGNDPSRPTPLYSLGGSGNTALTANTLTDATAAFIPGALVGLELNPNPQAQSRRFTIIANDATTLTTDPADGDMQMVAAVGDLYNSSVDVNRLVVRNHAPAEVVNGDANRSNRQGLLVASTVDIVQQGQLLHPSASSQTIFGLTLNVTGTLTVDATSRIDASGGGFLGGFAGDNASAIGRTVGNTTDGGSTGRSGGSHGGLGGLGVVNNPNTTGVVYGDPRDPNEPGAGGATACGTGNNSGGGVLRIIAGNAQLNGVIAADGASTGNGCSGGGAGGSIKLQAGLLAGTGSIHANGGSVPGGGFGTGGGGGGRVAVFFDSTNSLPLANIAAVAGTGTNDGAAGTIFIQKTGFLGDLIVRGSGRETPLPEGFATDRLVLDGAAVSAISIHPAALTLQNGATLTQPGATTTSVPRLDLQVGTLTVDATSKIDVSARGLLGGLTATNTDPSGRTVGNVSGSTGRSGGSHGGLGGLGVIDNPNTAAAVYDDVRNPNEAGGGGAAACGTGNNGGGVLRVAAASVQLDGVIAADGASNGNGCAGGGAGGSVALATGTLKGTGSIHANGGSAPGGGFGTGGGGGGRIAVTYDDAAMFTLTNVAAVSGTGTQSGAPGSIFLQRRGALGELIVRGSGDRETPLPESFTTDHMTIDGARVAVSQSSPASLMLRNGAVLTHPGATTTSVSRLDLRAGAMSIDAQSSIDVTGRGFLGGVTADNGDPTGRTFGNTVGSTGRSGGSHGGPGALGSINDPNTTGAVYDDFRDPTQAGGGGATACGTGTNNGGGVVHITADTLQLDGLIAADGASTGNGCTGGGAGGSIKLEVGTLGGGGSIKADGGNVPGGGNGTGGGGGGRVAIVYETNNNFDVDGKIEAVGGMGTAIGGMGTVYLRPVAQAKGTLRIDGKGSDPSRATPLYALGGGTSTALSANTLADANAAFIPGALVGLEVRPNAAQAKTFTIVANDATTLSTDPADGDLRTGAAAGNQYAAAVEVEQFLVRDHALAEVVNGDQNRADRRGTLNASRIDVVGTAQLVHPPASSATAYGLQLGVTGTLAVDASSRIDASGRGFLGGSTGDNQSATGRTTGNTTTGGSTGRSGGSHGGLGGVGVVNNPNAAGTVYGNPSDPNEPGAGGATACGTGANSGGGTVRIVAGGVQLNGVIAADGASTGNGCAGGGAGGSIRLDVGTLSGTGNIHASGGSTPGGGNGTGGGGGGRVAVFYSNASTFTLANVQAAGGSGTSNGNAGTVVLQSAP